MRIETFLAITLLTASGLAGCSANPRTPDAGSPAPLPVSVETIAPAEVVESFEAGGVVQARATAAILPRIVAPVSEVRVAPGDRVRAGAVLIVLDGRDLAAQARRALAAGASAEQDVAAAAAEQQATDAALALARATHARIAGLETRRSATAQELDEATGTLRMAEARATAAAARVQAARSGAESARAARDAADATETFSRLTAPFDGIVTEKMVEPGNMALPGTALMRLEDTRDFRLDVRVDSARVGQVASGDLVKVEVDGDSPGSLLTVTGTITEISRAVDADTRALMVKIRLPVSERLRSGMFGRAHFDVGRRSAVMVPPSAILRRGQVTSVFVVEDGTAHVRLVSLSGNEVLAGVSAGDVVVLAPPPDLTDGRRVSIGAR